MAAAKHPPGARPAQAPEFPDRPNVFDRPGAARHNPARMPLVHKPFWSALLLVLALSGVFAMAPGTSFHSPDELERETMAVNLAVHGGFALNPGETVPQYSKYTPLQSFLAAPLVKAAFLIIPRDQPEVRALIQRSLMSGTSAAALVLLGLTAWALWKRLGVAPWLAAGAAWMLVAAQYFRPYGRRFYSEPFTALFLGASALLLLEFERTRRTTPAVLAMVCAGLAGLNSPAAFVAMAPLGIAMLAASRDDWRRRWPPLVLAGLTGIACVTILLWLNHIRFGGWLETGYGGDKGFPTPLYDGSPGFSTPLLVGLHGLLLTPGKSIFLFAPMVLIGLWGWKRLFRQAPGLTIYCGGTALAYLLLYSKWWAWYGGGSWGPRLLIPAVALAAVPAPLVMGDALRRIVPATAIALALLWGGVSQLPMLAYPFSYDWNYWLEPNYRNEHLEWYTPQFSPWPRYWLHFREHPAGMDLPWLDMIPPQLTVAELPPGPARAIRLSQTGTDPVKWWSIAEMRLYAQREGRWTKLDFLPGKDGANISGVNPWLADKMFDGSLPTRWTTQAEKRPGQELTIDFGRMMAGPLRIVMNPGTHLQDYPHGMQVEFSLDGTNWMKHPWAVVTGDRPAVKWGPGFGMVLAFVLLTHLAFALQLVHERKQDGWRAFPDRG